MAQELKFSLKPNISDALSRSINYMTIDSQVCFQQQLTYNTCDIAGAIKAIPKTSNE